MVNLETLVDTNQVLQDLNAAILKHCTEQKFFETYLNEHKDAPSFFDAIQTREQMLDTILVKMRTERDTNRAQKIMEQYVKSANQLYADYKALMNTLWRCFGELSTQTDPESRIIRNMLHKFHLLLLDKLEVHESFFHEINSKNYLLFQRLLDSRKYRYDEDDENEDDCEDDDDEEEDYEEEERGRNYSKKQKSNGKIPKQSKKQSSTIDNNEEIQTQKNMTNVPAISRTGHHVGCPCMACIQKEQEILMHHAMLSNTLSSSSSLSHLSSSIPLSSIPISSTPFSSLSSSIPSSFSTFSTRPITLNSQRLFTQTTQAQQEPRTGYSSRPWK